MLADMDVVLVLWGIVLAAVSGVPGLLLSRHSLTGQRLANGLAVVASALGLAGVGVFWGSGEGPGLRVPWSIPGGEFHVVVDGLAANPGGEFHVVVDGLSAMFLVPVFLISVLGSVYGLDYWKQTDHPDNGRKLRLFYGLLTAGMGLVVIARNGILFLVAWEVMALAAYFLVVTEDERSEVRETGWVYLVATHVATLCLFALFALLRRVSGSFTLAPLPESVTISPGMSTAIFVLALVGFGVKAGIMPLHVWLPSAHAITPSHVSAIMSGVIIKMGIYGLVRVTSLVPHPPLLWGEIVLALGAVSGVLGVAFAIGQHDLKRLLAYHSIENIGIIVMGVGLALLGRSLHQPEWIVLGLSGGLLHVWNHALFKALLFLSAGSVIHAVHTREIDHLGGLAKRMPYTALGFLVGAVAICGLPPLNGFVSEFLIYLGLFDTLGLRGGPSLAGAAFAVPALALVGALAAACFVKAFGAVFLGTGRSEHAAHAHESGPAMLGPMAVLAACCVFIGLAPALVAPLLGRAVSAWAPEVGDAGPRLAGLARLQWITVMGVVLIVGLTLAAWLLWRRLRQSVVATAPTWACGYVAPTPRMQYTASSFAQMIVGLFSWALRPKSRRPGPMSLFPQKTEFHSDVPDVVLDEAVLPAFRSGARFLSWFRVLQGGTIQAYLLYIFLALIALMLWRV
jgi:hydrogenase-4 component B